MIEFKHIVKKFGDRTILKDISFKVEPGQICFVLGTSGTGKSVLLKNIVGLLRPEQGEIWIDGQDITKISEKEFSAIRKKCGMVFQHPALFDSLTVYENVAFGLRKHYKMSEEEKGFRERLSNDVNTMKKWIYVEEIKSFLGAIGFAMNMCCVFMLPFTALSLLNVFVAWYCLKQFKPTVKRQIMFHKHLEFLKNIEKEKVWTQSDK